MTNQRNGSLVAHCLRAVCALLLIVPMQSRADEVPAVNKAKPSATDSAMQRLDDFIKASSSFEADFEQRVSDGHGRLIETSSGKFAIRRPDRFRWDYLQPHEQTIVADGRLLWIYDPDLEQVTVRLQQQSLGGTPASLLAGDGELRNRFRAEKIEKIGAIDWLTLVPKTKDTDFKKVRLALKGSQLQAIELVDKLGQFSKLEFSRVKRDVAVDDKRFAFTPPPGADVIGAELMGGDQSQSDSKSSATSNE
jgi:outer membrane lipoprotein carrier protein